MESKMKLNCSYHNNFPHNSLKYYTNFSVNTKYISLKLGDLEQF